MSNTKDVIKWTAIYTVLSLIVASAVVFANVVISFGVIASLVLAGLWLGAIGGYIAEDRREEEQTPLAVKVLLATSTLGLLFASSIMFAGGVTITYITAVIGYAGLPSTTKKVLDVWESKTCFSCIVPKAELPKIDTNLNASVFTVTSVEHTFY